MKNRSFVRRAALALTVVLAGWLVSANVTPLTLAQGSKPAQANISGDEQKLAKAISLAPDAAGKLKAAAELIKKHPKTSLRPRVAADLAEQIDGVKDAGQKITLAQEYQGIFTETSEKQMIMPTLIDGFTGAKRVDEAFSIGAEFLTHSPDSLFVLVQLMSAGTDQARQKNPKFIPQSLQYGARAIELMEADKKPDGMDDLGWQKYKSATLPSLYQSMGVLNMVKGDRAEAKARLAKASAAKPNDAFNYLLLADILEQEYQEGAQHYKSTPNGPVKDEELKKILASLDAVIEAYAHAIALAEGNAVLEPTRQRFLHDMETYYKYRHNNSTAGMQQLIDKYKVPAK